MVSLLKFYTVSWIITRKKIDSFFAAVKFFAIIRRLVTFFCAVNLLRRLNRLMYLLVFMRRQVKNSVRHYARKDDCAPVRQGLL